MVYFGHISLNDETRLVKGLTMSRSQQDAHYCVGTTLERDVMFVQRTDTLTRPGRHNKETYVWNILVVDMHDDVVLPHVYLEGVSRHSVLFHETLAIKHRELTEIPAHLLAGYDPLFAKRFVCRTPVMHAGELPAHLSPLAAATIAHHFAAYDFEWFEDTLFVYYLSRQPSSERLDQMLNAGIWLAAQLEGRALD